MTGRKLAHSNEKNLNQTKNPTSDLADRFLKHNQLAQFY